jgi:hypothetical protein
MVGTSHARRAMSVIVSINAWPGTGKLTIGRLLARKIGARLLDAHTMLNPAEALFERGDRRHVLLRLDLRRVILAHAINAPREIGLVFTDALSTDSWDRTMFEHYQELAKQRGARLVSVVLDIAPEENARRLVSPERAANYKLVDPRRLAQLREAYTLLRPDDAVCLDVTSLSAEEAATKLAAHIAAENATPSEPRTVG